MYGIGRMSKVIISTLHYLWELIIYKVYGGSMTEHQFHQHHGRFLKSKFKWVLYANKLRKKR